MLGGVHLVRGLEASLDLLAVRLARQQPAATARAHARGGRARVEQLDVCVQGPLWPLRHMRPSIMRPQGRRALTGRRAAAPAFSERPASGVSHGVALSVAFRSSAICSSLCVYVCF